MAINGWLQRKYDIMGENADSQAKLANANVGAIETQTKLAPDEAAARNFQARGAGASGFGAGALAQTNAGLAPLYAQGDFGLKQAMAAGEQQRTQQAYQDNQLDPTASMAAGQRWGLGFSSGTSKIGGAGDGTVDTQPAMLAPGEAVLNKGAAEHLGRDTISLLNAIGATRMGLPIGHGGVDPNSPKAGDPPGYAGGTSQVSSMDVPGYAKGTAKVPGGKAPGGPTGKPPAKGKDLSTKKGAPPPPQAGGAGGGGGQLTPALLHALMSMGKGMPDPGQQQPMPMSMPQVAR